MDQVRKVLCGSAQSGKKGRKRAENPQKSQREKADSRVFAVFQVPNSYLQGIFVSDVLKVLGIILLVRKKTLLADGLLGLGGLLGSLWCWVVMTCLLLGVGGLPHEVPGPNASSIPHQ